MASSLLTLTIPRDAIFAMIAKTPQQAYTSLRESGQAPLMDVLTFAYVNTPIQHNETGGIVAYVSYWLAGTITVCRVEPSGQVTLLGVEVWDHWPSLTECEEVFGKYWQG